MAYRYLFEQMVLYRHLLEWGQPDRPVQHRGARRGPRWRGARRGRAALRLAPSVVILGPGKLLFDRMQAEPAAVV